jgi:hypothetical protein
MSTPPLQKLTMKKLALIFLIGVANSVLVTGQDLRTENVILVTLDGFRWQELFNGADSTIVFNKKAMKKGRVDERFLGASAVERREKLMPFFWNVIGKHGQLYGNRTYGNLVNCANPFWFSYPGYSEMLVGFVDGSIHSNAKKLNPNSSVLEYVQRQPGFEGKVAVFSTWDVIPYVVRGPANGMYTNGGGEPVANAGLSESSVLLNELQELLDNPHGERYDAFTFYQAFEYLKCESPRLMFISLDETDEHGHGGRYKEYLNSAHCADRMLSTLWNWIQSNERYRDKTTLIVTTDHGRGRGANGGWREHGRIFLGSNQMWFAAIGPDTPALGEVRSEGQLYQKQIAKTIASFFGLDYRNTEEVGETIQAMFNNNKLLAGTH